jgi:hypothetical protein
MLQLCEFFSFSPCASLFMFCFPIDCYESVFQKKSSQREHHSNEHRSYLKVDKSFDQ